MSISKNYSPRELAYSGMFGAAALLLPLLFHLVKLGSVFMPMYLPLVTLGFLVRPLPAGLTAAIAPLLSAVVTGMPPLYPPVAEIMSVELCAMAMLIAAVCSRWPRASVPILLAVVLAVGRVLHVGLVYLTSLLIQLPEGFLAKLSLLSGWPGLVLMLAAIPPTLRIVRRSSRLPSTST